MRPSQLPHVLKLQDKVDHACDHGHRLGVDNWTQFLIFALVTSRRLEEDNTPQHIRFGRAVRV